MKVLQLNVWVNASRVEGGTQGLIDLIDRTDPDVVLLCELASVADGGTSLAQQVIDELGKRGKTYYGDGRNLPVGILSKYKPEAVSAFLPTPEEACYRPVVKARLAVNGQTVTVYSTHLDHRNYAPYLSRGYCSASWGRMDAPVADPDSILAAGRVSWRDETIRGFLRDARSETARGHSVILGGDFNEPSHRDWQADTKDMRDHRGAVVAWDVSQMLEQAGYRDAWRQRYPDAVTHPGFTWPAGNGAARLKDLFSAPEADERDRIDFIYYCPQPGVTLYNVCLVGPAASVDHGEIAPDRSADPVLTPDAIWPSDHRGNLATFHIAPAPAVAAPARTEKPLTFAFLTDVHLNRANSRHRYDGLRQALKRAKETDAEFLIFGGDLVDINMGSQLSREEADSMYTAFRQAAEETGLPYYSTIGNHDRYFDAEKGCPDGDEVFNSHLGGRSYYTFEQRGVRFFVLNSVQRTDAGDLCIGAEQMEWLRRELLHVPLATPIVLAQHVPVYSLYYPAVETKFTPTDVVCNFREELEIFREHNLKLVLQGHQHIHEEIWMQDVQYITAGAVCANWWNGPFHGTEEGFLLVSADSVGEFDWEYVDFGWLPKK
jgi:endonuclease/exonuclease/phosphatase family metal-dependent hydrolase/UDP-2,3-diacylglucosamine pyrophosphatase LpxH